MSLIKRYSNHSLKELIIILESGDDYTPEAKDAVRTIIEFKDPSELELKEVAFEYWENRINDNIKSILLKNQKPISKILSKEEIKTIMITAFERYQENLQLFEIDTKKYWFV
tara:strand:+ start:162 stop:497 length:336 start_codon:yes stop_codon:yes gene_type:complete